MFELMIVYMMPNGKPTVYLKQHTPQEVYGAAQLHCSDIGFSNLISIFIRPVSLG